MQIATEKRAPGPRGDFLVGCLREFRRDPVGLLLRSAERYGDVVRLRIGPVLTHLVNHPDHIEHVLVQNARNYDKNTRSVAKLRATCGRSLLSTEGETWQRHRQLIQPAFQPGSLKRYVPDMFDCTSHMLDRWSEAARAGQPLDIVSEMMHVTLTIAARCLFGAEIAPDADTIERCLGIILDDAWRRLESWVDWSHISSAFQNRSYRAAVQEVDRIVYRIVDKRRQQTQATDDLLSILLRSHDGQSATRLDDQELRDACVTLLLAGHETTANALAWTCYLLARSEPVETRLRAELLTVWRGQSPAHSPGQSLGQFDVEHLTYTEQVFAEAIRLYPSIWIMERHVVADDEIAGCRIPGGSTVLISPYVLHRHAQFWPDCETFDPGRFAPQASAARPKLAYLPFGTGPHQCIGRHMASIVARVVLASINQRFRMRLVPGQPIALKPGITLRHRQRLHMMVIEDRI
ncbi:MAG: cytochrome P450 [Pirellulaceae bacterium]